jgi:hypothetical protein
VNADQIVDRLRELNWHIDDDGEKQLREVLAGPLHNAESVNTYVEMERAMCTLKAASNAATAARDGLKSALDEAQRALDDIERQQEILRDKMRELE